MQQPEPSLCYTRFRTLLAHLTFQGWFHKNGPMARTIPNTFGFWALWEAPTLSFSLTFSLLQENLEPLLKVLGSRAFVRYLSSNELPCMAHHTLGSAAPTRALMGARGRPVHCHVATHHPHYSPPHDGLLTKKNIKTAITTVPSMAPQHHENHTRPDRQTTKNA